MQIEKIDHLVMTVTSIDETIKFYQEVLGLEVITFGKERKALLLGEQKINLHEKGKEFLPKAKYPTVGCLDFCLITKDPIDVIIRELSYKGIVPIEGPVERTGAKGPILSIYLRDPSGNLIEIANQK